MNKTKLRAALWLCCAWMAISWCQVQAQSFGRNKPRYETFQFKVSQTQHFEIYEYLNNPDKLRELSAAAEMWYRMHQAVLLDTFTERNPMIIYNDHAGFQQTNVIHGDISVGTGGVTEAFRNRVVFPIAYTNQQTNHVLGHELVHAFQYHKILNTDTLGIRNFANIPLWMVEGLAEYLSIGSIDAHTAMWMRDAILQDDLPTLRDLTVSFKYFPYRWGHAFWAFVAGTWGDEIIPRLFVSTARWGLDVALAQELQITQKELSEKWHQTLREHWSKWLSKGQRENLPGKKLLDDRKGGNMNICPVLSPNGKYLVFLSEKNLFSIDVFLADAKTGKIIRKVASNTSDGHIDQMNFLESGGTWSPDSRRFAFDVYQKGRSTLVIRDVNNGRLVRRITMPGVPSFSNPAWHPSGKSIVVTGLVNGQTDLFLYDLKTGKVDRLTNDPYSEILPAWNADGSQLVFSTDELSLRRGRAHGAWVMNIAVMDMTSRTTEHLDFFTTADNLNPQFDRRGNLYFLSNRDGFRNLYYYETNTRQLFQMSRLLSGISGITPYAPALSVAEEGNRIVYNYFHAGKYFIYSGRQEDFLNEPITHAAHVDLLPATLPPFNPAARDLVNSQLRAMESLFQAAEASLSMSEKPYRSKFKLDYVGGSTGVGVQTGNSAFNARTGMAGGIDMLFGDIVGNHQLYTGLALNGEIFDAAGVFSYLNRKNRLGWGLSFSHIPQRFVNGYYIDNVPEYYRVGNDSILLYEDYVDVARLFQERIAGFLFYPISTTRRVEGGFSAEYYSQRLDRYTTYYLLNGATYLDERKKIPTSGNLKLANLNAAYVGDNSYFGGTAPLQGWRYHVGAEQFFGDFDFTTFMADGRRYFFARPFSLALRGLSYWRMGGNHRQIFPLAAFHPFLVRGYQRAVTESADLAARSRGSKLMVGNFEVRLPFTGPRKLALIPVPFLMTDLNWFVDAGVAFYDFDELKKNAPLQHLPIVSTGISLRANLFGMLVIEPFYALPLSLDKDNRRWVWGLNLIPGW